MQQIGQLKNHYGPIFVLVKNNGKYYWGIGDYNGFNEEEIPAYLYTALLKFGNIQSKPSQVESHKYLDPAPPPAPIGDRQFKLEKEIDTPSFFLPVGTIFTHNPCSNDYSSTTEENRIVTYPAKDVENSKFFSRMYDARQTELVDFVSKMRDYWKGDGHREVIEVGIEMLKHFDLKTVKQMIETISDKVKSNYE